jgi:hypothetical protein
VPAQLNHLLFDKNHNRPDLRELVRCQRTASAGTSQLITMTLSQRFASTSSKALASFRLYREAVAGPAVK